MKISSDIPVRHKFKTKYPFDDMNPGDSLHFRVEVLRKRALIAFRGWVERTGNHHLKAVSQAVGDDDPQGKGWRMWMFRVEDLKAMQAEQDKRDAETAKVWGNGDAI